MSNLNTVIAPFANCNLHLCLYGALGAILILRAVFAVREHKYDEAREHGTHGIVYCILGML